MRECTGERGPLVTVWLGWAAESGARDCRGGFPHVWDVFCVPGWGGMSGRPHVSLLLLLAGLGWVGSEDERDSSIQTYTDGGFCGRRCELGPMCISSDVQTAVKVTGRARPCADADGKWPCCPNAAKLYRLARLGEALLPVAALLACRRWQIISSKYVPFYTVIPLLGFFSPGSVMLTHRV